MPRSLNSPTAGLGAFLLILAACLSSCSRPSGKAGAGAAPAQGIYGRFEAIGGAQPPDPECQNLTEATARDSCEKAYLKSTVWPLKGLIVIRDAQGDSTVLALDSLGGFRAGLAAGFYSVCLEADGILAEDRCGDSLEVKAGVYTPYSRSFPQP